MQPTDRFVVRSTFGFLLVGFLALLGIVGMTFWLGERSQVYFNEAIEARNMGRAAAELRNAVQSAESSQRGFLLTGNEIYLAPYDSAKTTAQRQLDTLTRLRAPYEDPDTVMQRLTSIISEKFEEMDRTIALKRERNDAEVFAIIRTNRGKALTDEANVFFSGVIRAADDRLFAAVEEENANAAWLRLFSIVAAIVIVVMVAGATVSTLRYTRQLRAARDEVTILNAGLEERVTERTAELRRANDEIQRFAYIVTHDLRAPLVNIMGFTAELESGLRALRSLIDSSRFGSGHADPMEQDARTAISQDMPEAIDFIRSSTRKMDSLISAILRLSREGRRTLRPESLQIGDLIEASVAAIRHQIAEASGDVVIDADVPPVVSDKLSLEQIFGNLLDNAVKYRSQDRPLLIRVSARLAPGDLLNIEIADNGRGIAESDRERVFELFRRSGKLDQPGEGIGLPHAQTLIRSLGGQISMTSVVDAGTTFRIVLPLRLQIDGEIAA